jgi:hypothetical protein
MTSTIDRGDLKIVVRELMQEILWELEQQLPDPDTGEVLRPEVAEYLRQPAEHKEPYHSLEDVTRELGLDE